MLTHGGMLEIICHQKRGCSSLSDVYFDSLPNEIKRDIIMAGIDNKNKKMTEFRKKMALKQYDFEENTKEKLLKLVKKKG